jgi:hypothetical protein
MRDTLTPGALVVVGGHSRGVGKTRLIERLLRAHARRHPCVALKISAHRHASEGVCAPLIQEFDEPSPDTQTGRYLLAGARRAWLVRAPDAALPRAAAFIAGLRAGGATIFVESNRIVQYVRPDVLWFVIDPSIADWKASSVHCIESGCVPVMGACHEQSGHGFNALGHGAALGSDSFHHRALP